MTAPYALFPLHDAYGGIHGQIDPSLLDDAYPLMTTWAKAGVSGGVPAIATVTTVPNGSNQAAIQAAIDHTAQAGGGVVLLESGHYILHETLYLRDGVVLRGSFIDQVKIEIRMRDTFPGFGPNFHPEIAGITLDGLQRAGLEHLTIVYDETLLRPLDLRHLEAPFDDNPRGVDDLFITTVLLERCLNCWVEGCRITDSGSNNISLIRSKNCTVRFCEINGGHNRGGGHSYFNVSRGESCLIASCVMKDIRHLSIQNAEPEYPCRYNVVIGCDLEVDINFHNGDSGENLIEQCRIAVPSWHWWGPFAVGVKNQHQPPGPRNMIFRCQAERRRFGTFIRSTDASDPDLVYQLADDWSKPLLREAGPAPQGGTLYPIRFPEASS